MSIIEKLGIKRIDTVRYSDDETPWVAYNPRDIDELEQQKNELLVVLIELVKDGMNNYKNKYPLTSSTRINTMYSRDICIIEKACYPKKWEEIKEISNV